MKIINKLGSINMITLFHLCFFGFLFVILNFTIDNSNFYKGGDILFNRNLSEGKVEDYKKSSGSSSYISSRSRSRSLRSTSTSSSSPSTSSSTSSSASSSTSSSTSSSNSSSLLEDSDEGSNVDSTEEKKEIDSIDHDNNKKGNASDNIYNMLCYSNLGGYGCELKDVANYILNNMDMYDEQEAKKHAQDRSEKFSKELSTLFRKLKSKDPNMFNKNKIVFNDLSKKRIWDKYELHLPGLAHGKYSNERDVELNHKLMDLEDGFTDTQYIRKLYSLINENEKDKFEDVKKKIFYYCGKENKSLHRTRKESDQAWKYCEKLIKLYYNNFDKHFEKVFLIWLALSEGFNVFEYKMLITANRLLWRKLSDKIQDECKVMIQD
ncbi:Plasmodium exported protein (PHISTb), unknown function [Plasmodium sp. gorilla clade G2]|uniref:Plasmodium exported protein (PHISTb), unknown function n=1 Tax=Plasmodium sp. gorilla clade G2 TaxID=880535 RepID=UPI000D20AA2A|nr:Plasmodium exported protein (PHISTb), unknown function [Plasmodium sp. gorilla clade G2]SOV11128.1 Plasmodium exported protein (PHISTb), unknown function [Plasmodium sp. gorilla clade G2]